MKNEYRRSTTRHVIWTDWMNSPIRSIALITKSIKQRAFDNFQSVCPLTTSRAEMDSNWPYRNHHHTVAVCNNLIADSISVDSIITNTGRNGTEASVRHAHAFLVLKWYGRRVAQPYRQDNKTLMPFPFCPLVKWNDDDGDDGDKERERQSSLKTSMPLGHANGWWRDGYHRRK